MYCPECNEERKIKDQDQKVYQQYTLRRKECRHCGFSWGTIEVILPPTIKDTDNEAFINLQIKLERGRV